MHKRALVKATGEVVTIDTALKVEASNRGYLYRTADMTASYWEDELTMFDDCDYWEFIERWHPDYYHSQEVADSDDLQCCLDAEADDEKLKRVRYLFGDTPEEWERAQLKIDRELLEEAVEHFMSAASDSDRS